ncbi:hypothetical protein ACWD00_32905 [Streptomyces viridiviolaceus]
MTCAYLGGSAGSWLGIRVWSQAGWWGVCVLVALLAALALARHLLVLYEFAGRARLDSPEGTFVQASARQRGAVRRRGDRRSADTSHPAPSITRRTGGV